MEQKNLNFTAIDFETYTHERTSACAIGLVKVKDGHVLHRFYSIINPVPDNEEKTNTSIHGITEDMISLAPRFDELWPLIRAMIGDDIIVSHNAPFDSDIFNRVLNYYDIKVPKLYRFYCTYELTGLSLREACMKHNIELGSHHDALADAEACAKIYLAERGKIQSNTFKGSLDKILALNTAKKYDRATLDQLDDEEVENQSTPFFHAKVVITGVFNAYPNRNDLGKKLQSLGADMNTAISSKTNIVVMGDGAGPAKVKKINEINENGGNIRVIFESELVDILSNI